jgi:lysophospholipase L1-like esterase
VNLISSTDRRYLLRTLLYFVVFILILEIFVQLFIIKTPKVHVVPGFGMVPIDNSVGIWGVEGYGITHYLVNGEIRTPYDSGVSVVVLGDSYTEAAQVSDNEKYVSVTERILHDDGFDANLHNFGLSGRSIADYVYLAEKINNLYAPSVLVVQLGASDFDDSFDLSRPNYFVAENGRAKTLHQDNYFHLDAQNIIRNSGLGSLFIYRFKNTLDDLRFKKTPAAPMGNVVDPSAADGDSPVTTEDQKVFMGIRALQSAYAESRILFLVIPTVPDVAGQSVAWVDQDDQWVLSEISKYSDGPLVYPSANFEQLFDTSSIFPRGFFNTLPNYGHLNVEGHQAVARALADSLESLLR